MAGSLTAERMVSTAGVFLRRPSGASGMRLGGGGLAGPDGVALGAVLAGAGLAAGAGEGVDRWAVLHLDQADAFDDRLPPCARQGTGNSPGPQVDVAQGALGHGTLDADVGDAHAPAEPQNPVDFPVDADLVGAEVDDPVGDHHVGPAIFHGQVLDHTLAKLHVLQLELVGEPTATREYLGVMSTPMTRPVGPTHSAARKVSMPAPEPRSTTCSPGCGWSQWKGLATPAKASQAASGSWSSGESG